MKTKYVCRALICLYVNFHNNRTMWSTNLHVKFCRWGEKEKEPAVHVEFFTQKNQKNHERVFFFENREIVNQTSCFLNHQNFQSKIFLAIYKNLSF